MFTYDAHRHAGAQKVEGVGHGGGGGARGGARQEPGEDVRVEPVRLLVVLLVPEDGADDPLRQARGRLGSQRIPLADSMQQTWAPRLRVADD